MREIFFRFAPIILLGVGAGIWLVGFIFDKFVGVNNFLVSCILGQLLLFYFCGIIIRKLYYQANLDSLTGVYNRRCLYSKTSAINKSRYPVSLMMIDIDNFKRINDTYGHLAGDEVLRQFCEILQNNTRQTDVVARLGGEEFVVVMPQTSCERGVKTAERIQKIVERKTFHFDSSQDSITISIGIVTSKLPIRLDLFLKYADKALYKAKETKNAVVAYDNLEVLTA